MCLTLSGNAQKFLCSLYFAHVTLRMNNYSLNRLSKDKSSDEAGDFFSPLICMIAVIKKKRFFSGYSLSLLKTVAKA